MCVVSSIHNTKYLLLDVTITKELKGKKKKGYFNISDLYSEGEY